ncbi:iron-containing alcohol dehydrogenase [Bacillus sp. EB600]|uniref:iron-containing alcohol dehydrogenase n=1 Tax=Bacillus sp. EB600 TaxID=2806345 RepID=UPI00210C9FAA|nr:iron-containing alcohol dehydrogenase [Bacillus sp. EB600]MCQ6279599.1 iron-containing alcohol dehydrogenase [Bacillus sp. EB600]
MLLSNFQYSVRTAIHSGAGVRTTLPSLVHGLRGKRIILFTDKGLNQAGVTSQITEVFLGLSGQIQLVGTFDDIEQDARARNINAAIQFVRERNGDTLIALGGGSVLDTVKSVRWALHKGYSDIHEGLNVMVREQWPEAKPINIPFIAIPTTAGTGSEVSISAVIYNEKLKIKATLSNPYLSPDIALLDPELSTGLPPRITAFTGMDALTHAVEGYFSSRANPLTDAYALQAMKLILENLPIAVKDGRNVQARANMLLASSMAILAFTQTSSGIPVHNMAHVFGAKFGVPHGLANAVLLPEVIESLPNLYLPRIHNFARVIGIENPSENDQQCLAAVVDFIRQFLVEIELPNTFADFNIDRLDGFVEAVHSDPTARYKIPAEVVLKVSHKVSGLTVNA